MPPESVVREFKIVIRDNDVIDAGGTPGQIDIDPVRRRTVETLIRLLKEGRLNRPEEFEVLGSNLFAVLFLSADGRSYNNVGTRLRETMDDARKAKNVTLLRVALEFEDKEDSQRDLSGWPWEYLFWPPRPGTG